MNRTLKPSLLMFALGMVGLGLLALIYGDFALVWQPVAPWIPGRTALAYGSGTLMVCCGIGLLMSATAAVSIRILFGYLIAWTLLKVPALIVAPQVEAVWLGIGELTVLLAGGCILFARLGELPASSMLTFLSGNPGARLGKILFASSLLPIGLSHIMYVRQTAQLVPTWLPHRVGWAYLTGFGQIACGVGVLLSVLPRVAAAAEAAMLGMFALLVWAPAIVAAPKTRLPWTAFFITWAIASAAWVVAQDLSVAEKDKR